ncbi:MAG: hypothetical protein NT169_00035 [Chloroflexi bacterium]|nr:hypothetical protein [Chloroflexota bacterium]
MSNINQLAIGVKQVVLQIGLLDIALSLAEARQLQEALNDLFSAPRQPCLLGLPIYYGTWTGTAAYKTGTNNTSSSGATVSPAASNIEVT